MLIHINNLGRIFGGHSQAFVATVAYTVPAGGHVCAFGAGWTRGEVGWVVHRIRVHRDGAKPDLRC